MSIDLATVEVQSPASEPRPAVCDTWQPSAIDRQWWTEHSGQDEPYDEALEYAALWDLDDPIEDRRWAVAGRRMVALETGLTDEDVWGRGTD
jgi:hypothetical protein